MKQSLHLKDVFAMNTKKFDSKFEGILDKKFLQKNKKWSDYHRVGKSHHLSFKNGWTTVILENSKGEVCLYKITPPMERPYKINKVKFLSGRSTIVTLNKISNGTFKFLTKKEEVMS